MKQARIIDSNIIELVQNILHSELTGIVRYSLYSYMLKGYRYIPISDWFKSMATESLDHSNRAADILEYLDVAPNFVNHQCIEPHSTDLSTLIKESLKHEQYALDLYYDLFDLVKDKDIVLEEYARFQIAEESFHIQKIKNTLS